MYSILHLWSCQISSGRFLVIGDDFQKCQKTVMMSDTVCVLGSVKGLLVFIIVYQNMQSSLWSSAMGLLGLLRFTNGLLRSARVTGVHSDPQESTRLYEGILLVSIRYYHWY